jgi:Dolichyl-phosphate-mannose-protein mannosyltransferase
VSAVTAARARALAVPVWAWLGGIVVVSTALRVVLASKMAAPWIMIDELVYSELAKNLAAHGQFLVRGVPSHGYGFVYPLLIAPAWKLFGPIPEVYTAAKSINGVLMSLAAIPAYFLARRVLPVKLSLFAAVLAVLVPEMLFTGMLMTENAFYPIFLVAALLLVLTLERPTPLRQIGLLVVCALAFETRAQAIALFAAVVTAPPLLALVERRSLRKAFRPYLTLYGVVAAGALLAILGTIARGRSPLTLLGAYRAATSSSEYSVGGVLHFFLYHVAGLDLYLGILPFAAMLALWFAPRHSTPAGRAFGVASLALSFWLVAEVAAFASESFVDRIEERNMFYLAPLFLTVLLGLSVQGLVTRSRRILVAAAAVAGVLPVFIPFARFINTSAVSDTFALMPWWWAQDHLIHLPQVRWAALGVSLAAAALFLLLPRRLALVMPVLVGAYFVGTAFVAANGRHGVYVTTRGDRWAGTHKLHRDWIDRAVGRNASVAVVSDGALPSNFQIWEDEFFNRSVGTVYDVDGTPRPDPLPETPVTRRSNGVLAGATGPVRAQYVLAGDAVELAGKRIATDPVGMDLYRVNGPVVILTHVSGLYNDDTWSGKHVTYQRVECTGGTLAVGLQGDESLLKRPQTVTAVEGGRVVGRATIPVDGTTKLTVPLRPGTNRRCVVRFRVGRTVVPAKVEPGSTDTRELGAHFLTFAYNP